LTDAETESPMITKFEDIFDLKAPLPVALAGWFVLAKLP